MCPQVEFGQQAFICSGVLGGQFGEGLVEGFVPVSGGWKRKRVVDGILPSVGIHDLHGRCQLFLANGALIIPVHEATGDE